jgi:hypothetical protein
MVSVSPDVGREGEERVATPITPEGLADSTESEDHGSSRNWGAPMDRRDKIVWQQSQYASARPEAQWQQHAEAMRRDPRDLISDALGQIYTPTQPIRQPELFSGREELLNRCRRLFGTRGATLVLLGDRGVGKTSLCNVLLWTRGFWDNDVLRRNASWGQPPDALFASMLSEAGQGLTVSERNWTGSAGVDWPIRVTGEFSEKSVPLVPDVIDVNLVARRLGPRDAGVGAVVIDEVQEIADQPGRLRLAALAKAWADTAATPLLVLIGVGHKLHDLLGAEADRYGRRHLHPELVPPMSPGEARDIITRREHLGIRVAPEAVEPVIEAGQGQPWRVQRIMLNAAHSSADRRWPRAAPSASSAEPKGLRAWAQARSRRKSVGLPDLQHLDLVVEMRDVEQAIDNLVQQDPSPSPPESRAFWLPAAEAPGQYETHRQGDEPDPRASESDEPLQPPQTG